MKESKEQQAHSLWASYHSGKIKEEVFWQKYEALLAGTEVTQTKVVATSSTLMHKKRMPTNLHLANVVLKPQRVHYILFMIKVLLVTVVFFKASGWLFYPDSSVDFSGIFFSWMFLLVISVALVLRLIRPFHMIELTSKGVFIKNALFKFKVAFVNWNLLERVEVVEQNAFLMTKKHILIITDDLRSERFNYYLPQIDHHELARLVKQHQVNFKCTSSKYYPV